MKKSILNFASAIAIASLIFAPVSSFATDEFTYNSDTQINETNPDVILNNINNPGAGGSLNGGIIMTSGKLQLYSGFAVLGDINSDIIDENQLSFEGSYTLQGDIGKSKHFLLAEIQGNDSVIDLNGHELHLNTLSMNGNRINGDLIFHERGYVEAVAGLINGQINGASSGMGEVVFVGTGDLENSILGDIGQTNKMDNIRISSAIGTHTVNLNDHSISANTINIESGAILSAQAFGTGRMINGDIIIASGGVVDLWGGYVVSGDAKGVEDGVGVVNVKGNVINESALVFEFRGGSMGTQAQSLEKVDILEDGVLTLSGDGSIYATAIAIGENAELNIANGTIDGAINGVGGEEVLSISGNANILGSIGATSALEKIDVELGATFTINNEVHAATLNKKGGTIDFSNTNRVVNANVVSLNNSLGAYDFKAGDHTIDGTFNTIIGDELLFNVNHLNQGSLTTTGAMTMEINNQNNLNYAVKLKLDISGLDINDITIGETEYKLIDGAAGSTMTVINDSYITVGDSKDVNGDRIYGGNTYKNLNFNTRLDGDDLILTFSENASIFRVEEGDPETPASNISERSIIIDAGATLTMADLETSANNITVFGVLNTGSKNLNAFISGNSAGVGVVNIAGSGATFTSNGNIGYFYSLSDVNVLTGNTLNVAANNNFIAATNINIENDATLNVGAGDITGNIIIGENANLNVGDGDINGTIDGISPLDGERPLFSGKLFLSGDKTLTHNIGANAPIATVEIADSTQEGFHTISMNNMSVRATNFKIGDDAIVNLSGATITAASTLGEGAIINIGANVAINGNIAQSAGDGNSVSTFLTTSFPTAILAALMAQLIFLMEQIKYCQPRKYYNWL